MIKTPQNSKFNKEMYIEENSRWNKNKREKRKTLIIQQENLGEYQDSKIKQKNKTTQVKNMKNLKKTYKNETCRNCGTRQRWGARIPSQWNRPGSLTR